MLPIMHDRHPPVPVTCGLTVTGMFAADVIIGEKGTGGEAETVCGSLEGGIQGPTATIGDAVTGGDRFRINSIWRQ